MKKFLCLISFGIITWSSFGQIPLERRLTRNVIDCYDVSVNSSTVFIEYIHKNSMDSARMVLDFWEKHCGINEPIVRAKILLAILSSTLTESVYGSDILTYTRAYEERVEMSKNNDFQIYFDNNRAYFGYVPINSFFDQSTKILSDSITTFDNNQELLFSILYSDMFDSFYQNIQSPEFENSTIRVLYDYQIQKLKKMSDYHFDILFGSFIPTGNLKILGSHPEIGLSGGIKSGKITYDVTLLFRFGDTKEPYQVYSQDTILSTNYFFGGYFGLDLSLDLFKIKHSELLLLGGIGGDGFDTEPTDYYYNEVVSVYSTNLNFGLMYRWYFNNRNYVGLSYKYNIVDFNTKEIFTDLSGNFHTIRASIGGLFNPKKQGELSKLRYLGN